MADTNFWLKKKVLVTGHTGFKGSWLSLWLSEMGAQVSGLSLAPNTRPSLFEEAQIKERMDSRFGNIHDFDLVKRVFKEIQPELVFHMAAQPLVRYSYKAPVETYMTNVIGTVHVLDAALSAGCVRSFLSVTSDKCYENMETHRGYIESDPMGGSDPYSNSKGCAELVTSAYRKSFFSKAGIGLASARAGNVIGGGDWAEDRLVPDIVRSVLSKTTLTIRNPRALRPWQHVLEPLGGYLKLCQRLYENPSNYAEGFNFGPPVSECYTVEDIIKTMNSYWMQKIRYRVVESEGALHEASLLALDCEKAHRLLNWRSKWTTSQALEKTVEWNLARLEDTPVSEICLRQIKDYSAVG